MKKQKNYKKGPAPIYLRITVEGKRAEVTTGREIYPERRNSKSGRATGTKEDTKSLNAFLDNLQSKVYEILRLLLEKDQIISAEAMKNKMLGKAENSYMFIEIFKDHNQRLAALVGKEFSEGTLERYETSLRHTQEFMNYQYSVTDMDI